MPREASVVAKDWQCRQSGECCKTADAVVMTPGEFAAVRAVDDRDVAVCHLGDGRLEIGNLHGSGCPYYEDGCRVYPVRPGVCRSYGCFRKGREPYDPASMGKRMAESKGVRMLALGMWEEGERWTTEHP